MQITSLSQINYSETPLISFEATVLEVVSEGDGEKKPFKFIVKLEDSGEAIQVLSWKTDNLQKIKELVATDDVYRFEGQASKYANYGEQIRIGAIQSTGKHSLRKVVRNISKEYLIKEISAIVKTYIPNDSILYKIVKKLILEDENFFLWPAATKIHHNQIGGLALHSLNVCKNALSIATIYQGENISLDLLVAGALLHDIGKLEEYNMNGSRTIPGNLFGHHVIGFQKVSNLAILNGIDPISDIKIAMLNHIILSHHEKLEFGSPVMPQIMEAIIVAKADVLDACVETARKSLSEIDRGNYSLPSVGLPAGKILKWNN